MNSVKNIMTEIDKHLSEGFERELFQACLGNLSDKKNPLRVNNFAYSVRELVRHVLNRLSPDDDIRNCQWWEEERYSTEDQRQQRKAELKIYRTERMRYAIQGGLGREYVIDELGVNVDIDIKNLVAAIDELNKFTHIQKETFNLELKKQEDLINKISQALLNFFNMIYTFRSELFKRLEEKIFDAAVATEMYQTIQSLDQISGHYTTEELYVEKHHISNIDSLYIHVLVEGTISTTLQWGSNSDVRNGDGAVMGQDFPFSCNVQFLCSNPEEYDVSEEGLLVDTSSWTENFIDEENWDTPN